MTVIGEINNTSIEADQNVCQFDVFELLDATQEYLNSTKSLHEAIQEGWLNIARARYALGQTRVGQLQWKEESLEPQVLLSWEADKDGESPSEIQTTSILSLLPTPTKEKCKEDKKMKENEESPSQGRENRDKSRSNDPLRWFGLFSPPSLKVAQSNFQNSLPLLVDVANKRVKLVQLLEIYEQNSSRIINALE